LSLVNIYLCHTVIRCSYLFPQFSIFFFFCAFLNFSAPELLLGDVYYDKGVDMWAIGCLFYELLSMHALFPGNTEVDQLGLIFGRLGVPSDADWPGFSQLPHVQLLNIQPGHLLNWRAGLHVTLTESEWTLLSSLLVYYPPARISAGVALLTRYFDEEPRPARIALTEDLLYPVIDKRSTV